MNEPEKAELKSMDVADDKRRQLVQLFPEVVTETRADDGRLAHTVDFEKLKAVLGQLSAILENQKERYGMTWPGKNECLKIIQQPSIATLKPCREESVNFDQTENLFIEGDNLEVLKLLQKAYYGKIKMIYIDPPYNTGKEFIYPDKYSESLDTYLAYTGQVDSEGRKFSTNTEAEGRFHSKWLNMMLPRLYLARNLLRDDGVIFISIDDNEVDNLKKLCVDIFGEENLLVTAVWKKKYTGGKHSSGYVDLHEYILVCCKDRDALPEPGIARPDDEKAKFIEEDEFVKERGKFYVRPLKSNLAPRPTLVYSIKAPDGTVLETQWLVARNTFDRLLDEKRVEFRKKRDGAYQIYRKYYEMDGEGIIKPPSLIEKYPNTEAKAELKELFEIIEGRDNVFYTVKPLGLLKHLFEPYDDQDAIVLDFFAGSGTTAHVILDLNSQDSGNRKFILVQLPEPTGRDDYSTIADICKERIRRVIRKFNDDDAGNLNLEDTKKQNRGFRVYKLARSNFLVWDSEQAAKAPEDIVKQLELHEQHIDPEAAQEDILYELLLKAGFPLTTKVEKIQMAGKDVFSIADGALLICLERELTKELIKAMVDIDPLQVIYLDEGFKSNDQLKANAVQTFRARSQGKDKEAGIVFRTV